MTFTRRFVSVSIALALCACGSDPVLSDRDGGAGDASTPDAHVPDVDGGRGDAGPPPVDGGPACATREPEFPADPTAGAWEPGYANPGVGGDLPNVNSIGFGADGTVYIGGEFTTAGYQAARNIAAWDGATGWRPMGEGLSGRVRSIAVATDGTVHAAYAPDDGWEATRIARWNGTAWTTVAESTGSIEEIVFVGTTLLAAGGFTQIGGVDVAGLARFDGTTWTGYAGLAPDGTVQAISATSLNDVCIGGSFSTLGVVASRGAACWNGTAWQARPLPFEHYIGFYDLQRDPADGSLVGAGDFMLDDTGTNGGSIARWVGDRWELIGRGVMSEFGPGSTKSVRGVAFAPSGMYVGGAFRAIDAAEPRPVNAVARWREGEWDDIGGVYAEVGFIGGSDNVYMVGAGPDGSVYFGGLFTRSDSVTVSHVVRFDGTYWSALRTPDEEYEGVAGSVAVLEREASCAIYVGGTFTYAGPIRANNIARYTREGGYQALGDGVVGSVLEIEVLGEGRVVAGGAFSDESGTVFRNVALWDASEWRPLGGSVDGEVSALESVPADSPDAQELIYVGGDFDNAGEVPAEDLAMWNGEVWTAIGGGFEGYPYDWDPTGEERAGTSVRAILRDPESGDLIVAGAFRTAGPDGLVVNNIARWDGEAWHAYGDGLGRISEHPNALAFWNGRLVAVGTFESSGETTVGRVAAWNGTAWEAVGPIPLEGFPHVVAVEAVGSALYVGGSMQFGEGEGTHVAVYDGTTWTPLGEGASDIVEALVGMDEGVYVGGTFDRTGTSPSVGLSLWRFAP
ncbi:hypothetical protein [Sandaracinus amylolyticus]|uniref:hypothetical protein n=1 Tax=Sandaracinus amylolyticus TaxID=927083 RepID=UPI001F1EFC8D|nr:hypothetical protein [Sandaracinus amylolyticus]UJR82805.1 Hypothetical protein I5071_48700 [Sandaracinus amylolyticus]